MGRAVDTVKKSDWSKMTRFLIMLERTDTGFAVQAPDLAIATYGENSSEPQSVSKHLQNPEFWDLLFAYVE